MGISPSASNVADNLPSDFPKDVVFFHLTNLTNTCYCNSVLQTFLFSNDVAGYFLNLISICNIFPSNLKNTPLFNFLLIYNKKLQYDKSLLSQDDDNVDMDKKNSISRDIYIRPSAFLESIYHETSQFVRNQQNDSHEFLLYLISSFDKTISQLKKFYLTEGNNQNTVKLQAENKTESIDNNCPNSNVDNDKVSSHNDNAQKESNDSSINNDDKNNDGIIKKIKSIPLFSLLFEGKRSSSFECAYCHQIQEKIEKFTYLDISIPLENNNKQLDLQKLIDFSLDPDNISADEGWVCDNCKKKGVNVEITSYIKDTPPTLLIQLQRFKYSKQTKIMEKINKYVKIQNEIHLNSGDGPKKYKLHTIICHIGGSLYQGHFVAIHRVPRDKSDIDSDTNNSSKAGDYYILASDSTVKLVDQMTVHSLIKGQTQDGSSYTPYVLLYEISN